MIIEVFNLMSSTNETCACKCGLDASVCNNKQCWNSDKFRYGYKELIDKHYINSVRIWGFSGSYFVAFEWNTGRYREIHSV